MPLDGTGRNGSKRKDIYHMLGDERRALRERLLATVTEFTQWTYFETRVVLTWSRAQCDRLWARFPEPIRNADNGPILFKAMEIIRAFPERCR